MTAEDEEYDETRKRGSVPLYIAGTIITTILLLAAFKSAFGIDVIGSILGALDVIPRTMDNGKDVIRDVMELIKK